MIGEQFFQWLEDSWDIQSIWEKGLAEKNKESDVQYNMTYEQFKIMSINKLKEIGLPWEHMAKTGMPLGTPIFGGIDDEPMST